MMAHRLEKNITDDYLTCTICFGTFKDPRKLSCGHSFCFLCLLDYAKPRDKVLDCPICRRNIDRPDETNSVHDWINSIPQDNLLEAIVSAVNKHTNKENRNLTDEQRNTTVPSFCKEHGQNYDQICLTHLKMICVDCVEHNNCECSKNTDVESLISSKLTMIDSQIVSQLTELAQVEQRGLLSLSSYNKQKTDATKLIESIRKQFQEFSTEVLNGLKSETEVLDWPEINIKSSLKKLRMQRSCLEQIRTDAGSIKERDEILVKLEAFKHFHENAKHILEERPNDSFSVSDYQLTVVENQDF